MQMKVVHDLCMRYNLGYLSLCVRCNKSGERQVPGESYLAVLDGLYDAPQVEVVICRQEGGAAMMAEADGKMTGRSAPRRDSCHCPRGAFRSHLWGLLLKDQNVARRDTRVRAPAAAPPAPARHTALPLRR